MTDLQIRYFLKVTDSMSFSTAAKELYVSQPSVSRQVQQLEQELGFSLFDRSNKSMITLTPAGMVFRDSFRKMRADFQQTVASAREVTALPRLRLSVGIGEGWDFSEMLSRFCHRVQEQYPLAELRFLQEPFSQLRTQVRAGQLDVAICTRTSIQEYDGLELAAVGSFHSCFYVKNGLLKPEGERLELTDLVKVPMLMLPDEEAPMSTQIILLKLQEIRYRPEVIRMPNRASIVQALLQGTGFVPMDDHMEFAQDRRLARIWAGDEIPICAIWKKENQNPLIRLLVEVANEPPAGEG